MKTPIRAPRITGDVEFNRNDSGLGAEEATVSMTRFEAKLARSIQRVGEPDQPSEVRIGRSKCKNPSF